MPGLQDLISGIAAFPGWTHVEKIKLFGWFLHTERGREEFTTSEIRTCYDELNLERPSNAGVLLKQLEEKKPKETLRTKNGYKLESRVRQSLDEKFGKRAISVQVAKLLEELPMKVPDLSERTFLNEALSCLKCGAFRAAIVMTWNLAFHHLLDFITKHPANLVTFNAAWVKRYPGHHKSAQRTIAKIEDFSEELKEREVIEISKTAGLVSSDLFKILAAKLDARNSAAHPSTVKIEQLQAESFIDDLVKNVVLKLGT